MITPLPFECTIQPREGRARVIKDCFWSALEDLKKHEVDLSIIERERMEELRLSASTDSSIEPKLQSC